MRLVVSMILLFIVAQVLGVYTGIAVLLDMNQNQYVQDLIVTTNANEPFNAVIFIGYIVAGAIAMIVMIRFLKKFDFIFTLLEFMLVSTSSSIVFYAFLRLALGIEIATPAGILMGLGFAFLKMARPRFKNLAAILATAGVGVIFGISLGPAPLIIFLIFLSIYDFLSVFKTKHMVEMADFVMKKDLAFTVTAYEPDEKEKKRIDLGTGDMIAPIMLEVSALSMSPIASLFVFIGAVISFSIFIFLVWNKKMILPALPPIVFGMITFLFIGLLLGFY